MGWDGREPFRTRHWMLFDGMLHSRGACARAAAHSALTVGSRCVAQADHIVRAFGADELSAQLEDWAHGECLHMLLLAHPQHAGSTARVPTAGPPPPPPPAAAVRVSPC